MIPKPLDTLGQPGSWLRLNVETSPFHQRRGFEFPWACGPPMEMKAAFPRPIDSKWVKARLSTECNHQQNLKTMRGAKSNALFLRRANWNRICPCVALVIFVRSWEGVAHQASRVRFCRWFSLGLGLRCGVAKRSVPPKCPGEAGFLAALCRFIVPDGI